MFGETKTRYPWLKKLQDEEAKVRQDLMKRSDAVLAQGVPLSLQYGFRQNEDVSAARPEQSQFSYTGDGGNGQVEPNKPVEMVQSTGGPRMIHEGEGKMQNPDGSTTVIPQQELMQMEQRGKIPGYAEGGTFYENVFKSGVNNMGQIAQGRDQFSQNQQNALYGQYKGQEQATKTGLQQSAAQLGMDKGATLTEQAMRSRDTAAQYGSQASALREQQGQRALSAAQQMPQLGMQGAQYEQQKKTTEQDEKFKKYLNAAESGDDATLAAAYQDYYGQPIDTATAAISDIRATAKQQRADQLSQTTIDRAKEEFAKAAEFGDDATVRAAYEKYFGRPMDPGASVNEIRTYARDMRNAGVSSAMLGVEAQMIDNEAKRWNLTASRAEEMIKAVNSGVPNSVIKDRFGITLTDAEYDDLARKYTQAVRAGDIANDAADFGLDNTKMEAAIRDINNGVSKDIVNGRYGLNLTDSDYSSMQEKYKMTMDSARVTLGSQRFDQIQQMANSGMMYNDATKNLMTSMGISENEAAMIYSGMSTMYDIKVQMGYGEVGAQTIANQAAQVGLDSASWNNVVTKINDNATFDQVKGDLMAGGKSEEEARIAYDQMRRDRYARDISTQNKLALEGMGINQQAFDNMMTKISNGATFDQVYADLQISGFNGTEQQARDTYASMSTKYNLGVKLAEIQVDASKFGLDTNKFEAIYDKVKMGVPSDQITSELIASGVPADQAPSMASGMIHMAYGKEDMIAGIKVLLETGGTDNINQASALISGLYGINLDPTKIKTEDQRAGWVQGMGDLATIATTFKTYDEAVASGQFDASAIMKQTGMTEPELQKAFEKMVLAQDPLYQSTYAIADSTLQQFFPGKTPQESRGMIASMVMGGFMTVDENGMPTVSTDKLGEFVSWLNTNTPAASTGQTAVTNPDGSVTVTGVKDQGGEAPATGGIKVVTPIEQEAANLASLNTELAKVNMEADPDTANNLSTMLGHYPTPEEYRNFKPIYEAMSSGDPVQFKDVLSIPKNRTVVLDAINAGTIKPPAIWAPNPTFKPTVDVLKTFFKDNVGKVAYVGEDLFLIMNSSVTPHSAGQAYYTTSPTAVVSMDVVDLKTGVSSHKYLNYPTT